MLDCRYANVLLSSPLAVADAQGGVAGTGLLCDGEPEAYLWEDLLPQRATSLSAQATHPIPASWGQHATANDRARHLLGAELR